jgi:enoyl-CoA hydratase
VSAVRYERRADAAWLTFDRPEKRNALTPELIADFAAAFDRAENEAGISAVVLTGAGVGFCAGADLGYFAGLLDEGDGLDRFMAGILIPLRGVLERMRDSRLPVIAAVNGGCFAGGLEIVLCCDLVVAGDAAVFSDAHALRGFSPALGGAPALVRAIGSYRAKELLMSGAVYDAATMHEFGLVSEVVRTDELAHRAGEVAATLGRRSGDSIAVAKRMVHGSEHPSWSDGVDSDLEAFARGWASADMREGLRAYLDRREPVFAR